MSPSDKHRWIGWRRLATPLLFVTAVLASSSIRANETLTYDANGNVQTRTLPGGTTTFGYDDLDRLNSEAGPAKTQNLTYDPNGNRTADNTGTHTYAPNTDRLATINGVSVSLDAAGHITAARGYTYTWNQAGQLKSVKQGTKLTSYYYDYKGRRTRKVVAGSSQVFGTTIYTYDAQDRLTGELDGYGTPYLTYVWRDNVPVAIILHSRYDDPESVLYLETDHLGTPFAASNKQGTVVWRWEPDAFGTSFPNEDPDGDGIKTTINLRFQGQYYDKESGLHYNWHRYYDPKLGRYFSPDPIGVAGGINPYAYVEGNPISYVDPEGLSRANPFDPNRFGGGAGGGGARGGSSGGGARGPVCSSPSQSPVWDKFQPYRDGTKTNGQSGKDRQYYQWDRTHGDIEVYDRRGRHQGSMHPETGEMYKPPVSGRTLSDL